MILIYGILSEPPLRMVLDELRIQGSRFAAIDQRNLSKKVHSIQICGGRIEIDLCTEHGVVSSRDVTAIYARPINLEEMPEFYAKPGSVGDLAHKHQAMISLLNSINALVVNRPSAMISNTSKPLQLNFIRKSEFNIPDTLITNDRSAVLRFMEKSKIIVKSVSGIRSTVRQVRESELLGFQPMIPVQFQRLVEGIDVRVHVIGDEVLACAIFHDVDDYRKPHSLESVVIKAIDHLPPSLLSACVHLTRRLGLFFSGLDLRVTKEGVVTCFEVNPSPAFSYYELHSGLPIARALARQLSQATSTDLGTDLGSVRLC